jgi:hypothetical protein
VTLVERVTITEHFMRVEYVPVSPPEHRARSREPMAA